MQFVVMLSKIQTLIFGIIFPQAGAKERISFLYFIQLSFKVTSETSETYIYLTDLASIARWLSIEIFSCYVTCLTLSAGTASSKLARVLDREIRALRFHLHDTCCLLPQELKATSSCRLIHITAVL